MAGHAGDSGVGKQIAVRERRGACLLYNASGNGDLRNGAI